MIDVTRYDFLDFPTAWAIQRAGGLEHRPRCSSVPGWDPISGPGFLCDCGAVETEWRRLRDLATGNVAPIEEETR